MPVFVTVGCAQLGPIARNEKPSPSRAPPDRADAPGRTAWVAI